MEKEDQVVEVMGGIGRWQWIVIILVANNAILTGMQVLVASFLTPTTDFICIPHQTDSTQQPNKTYDEWVQVSKQLLRENGTISTCTSMRYVPNVSLSETNETCQFWSYNTSFYPSTVITQFDLVCSSDYLVTLSQSVLMSGVLFGSLLSGMTSDKIGRKYTLLASSMGLLIFGVCAAFANSIGLFIALRFLCAFFSFAVYTTGCCYCMEIVGGRWTIVVGIGLQFPWAIGYSLLALIAYAVPDWSLLQLTISVPMVVYVLISAFLPESPRWLLAQGRLEDTRQVMNKALKCNGKQWPEGKKLTPLQGTVTDAKYFDLLRFPNLRKKTLLQFYLWFTCSLVYYGLTFNAGTLLPGGDLYVNFMIGAVIEFPAYFVSILLLLYFGRRIPLVLLQLACGVSLLLMLAVEEGGAAATALSSVGKFCNAAAFAVVYVYAAELFPTALRNTGLGSSSTSATVGSMLAPVVGRELGKAGIALPVAIFAGFSLLAGVAAAFLPETHGRMLPDTVEEGEAFGKDDTLFRWLMDKFRSRKRGTPISGAVNEAFD